MHTGRGDADNQRGFGVVSRWMSLGQSGRLLRRVQGEWLHIVGCDLPGEVGRRIEKCGGDMGFECGQER